MEPGERNGPVAAVIPAGGIGSRFGQSTPKQFLKLDKWPILAHTLFRFEQTTSIDQIILVVPEGQEKYVRSDIINRFGFQKIRGIVAGGAHRQDSVYNGFMALRDNVGLVVIHDGVRPLVKVETIEAVIQAARRHGAAIAAIPVKDTLKQVQGDIIVDTLDRGFVWQAQTPQAFDRRWLAEALAAARRDNFLGTDEAILIERIGRPVHVVPGSGDNLKITLPDDLVLAETLLEYDGKEQRMRVGIGYDIHALAPSRPLMLGGLEIPFDRGLAGHSDADVIIHALCDALLSAAGLPDIGVVFPDSDPNWAGAPGLTLLKIVGEKTHKAGFDLINADVTLLAERPRIKDFKDDMCSVMAAALAVDRSRLNVKGKTAEGLGPVGRGEGMAAWAVALLTRRLGQ